MSLENIANNVRRRMDRPAKSETADDEVSTAEVLDSKLLRDATRLPDEKSVDDLTAEELAKALVDLKIPGAASSNSKFANLCVYACFLAALREQGGKEAVSFWKIASENPEQENEDE